MPDVITQTGAGLVALLVNHPHLIAALVFLAGQSTYPLWHD